MTRTNGTDWTGRELRVRLEGPAHGGEFVARHEGRVIFCRGGLTGELVDVLVTDDPGRAFCRASVKNVVEASPERTDPRCPAAAAGAGCCDWSHIAPDAARDFSGWVLADQVRRIGRIDLPDGAVPVETPAGDEAAAGWRTVGRWVTGPDGVPGVRRARSREVITERCVQSDPRIVDAVLAARVGPGREILGVLGDDGTVHVAHRATTDPAQRGARRGQGRASATRARARHARAGAWEFVTGPPAVTRAVAGHTWHLPADAFWQAHRSAAGHYADLVRTAVSTAPGLPADPLIWDLYGGAGLFAAAALDAAPGARVTVVESAAASLGAVAPALGADAGRVRTVRSRVEAFLGDPAGGSAPEAATEPATEPTTGVAPATAPESDPHVVVLDPPRGGAGIAVMQQIAARARIRVVHVGCDPASLARDVGVLVAAGWKLADLRGVASFPGTHHVEGLAVLDAPSAR